MAIEITMPKLSDTMTEGVFASWKKHIGDHIERGDIIAEVETDKAVMELEAFASGVLIKTVVHEGEQVMVGAVLGFIGESGEIDAADIAASAAEPPLPASAGGDAAAPTAAQIPPVVPQKTISAPVSDHEKSSPMVRHQARELGIDLSSIHGSGPDGRITQADVAAYSRSLQSSTAIPDDGRDRPEAHPVQPLSVPASVTATQPDEPLQMSATSIRQAIASTVTRSWQTIPHFSVTLELGMEACREIVDELKDGEHPIGYNALIIKACASALIRFPRLIAAETPLTGSVNISFAVALENGLLMPVIKDCQSLSVEEIQRESDRLTARCRSGKLASEELGRGNFSVSNLGMYGVDAFTALIMPGQAAILAIGAVSERPVVRHGAVAVAPTLLVTLSCDHRAIDGAYAASFMAEVRSCLEKPVALLM